MTIEKVRETLGSGTRAFLFRTSDGREYHVPHTDYVLVGKHDIALMDNKGEVYLIDPSHIVAVRTAGRKNGN